MAVNADARGCPVSLVREFFAVVPSFGATDPGLWGLFFSCHPE